jgi:hypothetical protein
MKRAETSWDVLANAKDAVIKTRTAAAIKGAIMIILTARVITQSQINNCRDRF